ncbi:hypothetical protein HMPREF1155_0605 [Slackia sp. CM382]|nr:hypothetical protein HMPREF1155_0605 [Slackia sp. CM382]
MKNSTLHLGNTMRTWLAHTRSVVGSDKRMRQKAWKEKDGIRCRSNA